MPIRSYLEPRRGGSGWIATGRPMLGSAEIVGHGPVLEGRMSLDEALVRDRIRAIEGIGRGAGEPFGHQDAVDRAMGREGR